MCKTELVCIKPCDLYKIQDICNTHVLELEEVLGYQVAVYHVILLDTDNEFIADFKKEI